MKITAVILYKTGKEFPERTINSLKGNVDEIVLVNTNSEYNLISNKKYQKGINYKYKAGNFSFADARNIGIKKARGDYIFTIDTDETLVSKRCLKDIINKNIVDVLYINIKQWHTYLNGSSQYQEYNLPRIFYKTDKLKYSNDIHESISSTLAKDYTHYIIPSGECYIAHIGYDLSVKGMKDKLERNISLTMKQIDKGKYDAYTYYHLGKLFGIAGNIQEQLDCYEYALKLGGLNEYHKSEVYKYILSYTKVS